MTPFRWKNCLADVQASKHGFTIQSYFEDVILPAIATLDQRIDELGRSDWPGHQFAQSDMEEVLGEAKLAFGLSIQSIWERQLRAYLTGCAGEICPEQALASKLTRADWPDLRKLFRRLRGIALEDFPSFEALDTLQHLGNACRHGDGASAVELARRYTDLWQPIPPMPPELNPPPPTPPSVAMMNLSIERLRGFVEAIAAFWRDAEYIYNESIERKHPSLEERLARERNERLWLPQAGVADAR